uniref:WSN domain-containing protein n=1 Tax=Caenorhabditis tropicalis TaxID=1561998 RepID=A0A1I7UP89_9PELO
MTRLSKPSSINKQSIVFRRPARESPAPAQAPSGSNSGARSAAPEHRNPPDSSVVSSERLASGQAVVNESSDVQPAASVKRSQHPPDASEHSAPVPVAPEPVASDDSSGDSSGVPPAAQEHVSLDPAASDDISLNSSGLDSSENSDPMASENASDVPLSSASLDQVIRQASNDDESLFALVFPAPRDRRAATADPFAEPVANLVAVSHISSAAALQIGLMNGSIPPDGAVAELLGIGPLTLKDIINLDTKKLIEAANSLPMGDPNKKAMEDWLIGLDDIQKKSEFMVNTFASFPGKKEYVEKLADVENIKDVIDAVSVWKGDLTTTMGLFESIDNAKDNMDDSTATNIFSSSPFLKTQLNKITVIVSNVGTALAPLIKAKGIEEHADFYMLLVNEAEHRKQINTYPAGSILDLTDNFNTIYAARDGMKPAQPHMETLLKLIDSRNPSFRQDHKFSEGLPLGYVDLQQLHQDSGNKWIIQQIPNGTVVSDGFKAAFSAYKPLTAELEQIETKHWKGLRDDSVVTVINTQRALSNLPGDAANAGEALQKLKTCENDRKTPSDTLDETKLEHINELNQKMKELSTLAYANQEFLNALTGLIKLIPDNSNNPDKVEAAKSYVNSMKSSEHFGIVKQKIGQLQTDVSNILKASDTIPGLVSSVRADIVELEKYQAKIAQEITYFKFFTCLNGVANETTLVKNVAVASQQSRVDPQTKEKAIVVIKQVEASKNPISSAETYAAGFKNIRDREPLLMKESFGDKHLAVSNQLGKGVQGVVGIHETYKATSKMNSHLTTLDNATKDPDFQTLSNEEQNVIQQLLLNLPQLLNEVGTTVAGIKSQNSTGFEDCQQILEKTGSLKGINIDKKLLRQAVESLIKTIPTKYDDLLNLVDILDPLDLDYARFQIKKAIPVLSNHTGTFAKFSKLLTKPVPRPPGPPLGSNPNGQMMISSTAEPGFMHWYLSQGLWYKILEGIGAAVLCSAIGGGAIWLIIHLIKPKPIIDPTPDNLLNLLNTVVAAIESKTSEAIEILEIITMNDIDDKEAIAKKARNKDTWNKLEEARRKKAKVAGDSVPKIGTAAEWLETTFEIFTANDKNMLTDVEKGNRAKRRYHDYYCIPQTMSKISGMKDNFVNSNAFRMPDGITFHMAQAPMTEEEGRDDTCENHWAVIDQNDVGIILQLCSFVEGGTIKCGEYYSTELNEKKEFGIYVVKTIKIQKNPDGFTNKENFILYTIELTNNKTKKVKKVDILFFNAWPDFGVPKSPVPCLEMIKHIDGYKKNVFVHCSAGVGRTGTLTAVRYGLAVCEQKVIRQLLPVIGPIRDARYGAVQRSIQIFYTVLAISMGIIEKHHFDYNEDYFALEYYFEKCQKNNNYWEPVHYLTMSLDEVNAENMRRIAINIEEKEAEKHLPLLTAPLPSSPQDQLDALRIDRQAKEAYVAKKMAEQQAKKAEKASKAAGGAQKKGSSNPKEGNSGSTQSGSSATVATEAPSPAPQ